MSILIMLALFAASPSFIDGDQAFDSADYAQAAAIYHSTLATTSDSAEVFWRLARVYVCMGDIANDDDDKMKFYFRADTFAQRCTLSDSMKGEGHTWRAAALGNIAMFEGGRTKVGLTHIIKRELDYAISINPNDDIAYSILGSFYLALGNVSWFERQLAAILLGGLPDGGYPEAERDLKKAIALAPRVIRHHFELGRLYVATDRHQEALEEFKLLLGLPIRLRSDEGKLREAHDLIVTLQEE